MGDIWALIGGVLITAVIFAVAWGIMRWTDRKARAPRPRTLRYNPRCAVCGWDLDSMLNPRWRPFDLHYDKETMQLTVTCPRCRFSWSRGLADEERVRLLKERIEEKEEA